MVPTSALAMAAGAGGCGIVGPPMTVSIPDAVASLIWLEMWRRSEKPPNRVQFGGFSLLLHISSLMRLATASVMLTVIGGPTIPLPPAPAAIARADVGTITRTPLA